VSSGFEKTHGSTRVVWQRLASRVWSDAIQVDLKKISLTHDRFQVTRLNVQRKWLRYFSSETVSRLLRYRLQEV